MLQLTALGDGDVRGSAASRQPPGRTVSGMESTLQYSFEEPGAVTAFYAIG